MALARQMLDSTDMRSILPALITTVAFATGCYATTEAGYNGEVGVGVEATTVAPDLVYAAPGVQVVADYDYPVFFVDGFYWREMNGGWYRSSYHTGGWAAYGAPPRAVFGISNRESYRHYRPAGYVPRNNRAVVRDHREPYRGQPVRNAPAYNRNQPMVRDHREQPVARPVARPAPAVRDHREEDKKKKR